MRKLSKVPTQMGETVGIDLGDKVSRYCVVDPDGEVMEEGSFRNQSAWISRELKKLGHEVIVANPCWRRSSIAVPNSKRNWP